MTKTDQKPAETALVPVTPHGGVPGLRDAMMPQTFDQLLRFAEMVQGTSFVPQAYKGKPGEIVAAVTYGAEIGLSPMQSLRSIAVINGTPAVYGDGLLAVCQAHPQWSGKEEWYEGEGKELKAICVVRRKGETDVTAEFSMTDAQKAQLASKSGPWQQYTKRMLQMRARGFALRDQFADALRGMVSEYEAADMPAYGPDRAKDVTPKDEPEARGNKLDAFAAKHGNGEAQKPRQEAQETQGATETMEDATEGDKSGSAAADEAQEGNAGPGEGQDHDADTGEVQDEFAEIRVRPRKADGKELTERSIPEAEEWLSKAPVDMIPDLLEQNRHWIDGLPDIRRKVLEGLAAKRPA